MLWLMGVSMVVSMAVGAMYGLYTLTVDALDKDC